MNSTRDPLTALARKAAFCLAFALVAIAPLRAQSLHLGPDDVLPTGNEWLSLPDIRAVDGALVTFNVLSTGNEWLSLPDIRASDWDGGIITEGVSADTGKMDQAGRAFATAAGYMAHAICRMACTDR